MAKKSAIARNNRRKVMVARYAERRAELKAVIRSPRSTPEAKAAAVSALQAMPRDASRTRVRNRDAIDGRPRGYVRAFGLSRIHLRDLAHRGELPGVRKSSW
ncbi:30S ribosomal protein S14 [Saccharomonospora xinjiangensis]|uniref:Small ribosomal subunit protein uS14 n=1 Tax=Saccharomonospora xinjiangensis XJ-54 TaxID=882086 RepID=I0UZ29_9PSEU|nr:30S ribosomal protein S14 [Saccharomonospora xinjiangensis]EID53132.1 ribosomal protein S14 [Saccharomonospora xinjiangensis XJ-54]